MKIIFYIMLIATPKLNAQNIKLMVEVFPWTEEPAISEN